MVGVVPQHGCELERSDSSRTRPNGLWCRVIACDGERTVTGATESGEEVDSRSPVAAFSVVLTSQSACGLGVNSLYTLLRPLPECGFLSCVHTALSRRKCGNSTPDLA
ncbi:unnamed protein product [Ectocarpus sp. 4 AP-2014]